MRKKNGWLKSVLSVILALSLVLPVGSGAALAAASANTAGQSQMVSSGLPTLDQGRWAPNAYKAVQSLIDQNGKKNPNYNAAQKPYAVFDWDNTCVYADTEEHTLIYQLNNLKYKMTPEQFRYAFTHGDNALIPETNFVEDTFKNQAGEPVNITKIADDLCKDYQFFWDNYKGLNPNATNDLTLEQIQSTDQFKDFKAKFWFTYYALDVTFDFDISWTWLLNFFTGYTPAELKALTVEAVDWALAQESKKVYFDSPESLPGEAGVILNSDPDFGNYFRQGLRLSTEVTNLMNVFRANGIDVYISTASLNDVIRAVAGNPKYGYNVPEQNVIGMQLTLDANGRYQSEIPDKTKYAINAKHGKAVNINNILVPKHQSNPIFIAGDSNGDYGMMVELSGLNNVEKINNLPPTKLVLIINRLKTDELYDLCKIAEGQLQSKTPQVVLQGRDENTGMWIPTAKTLKLGKRGDSNLILLGK
ncbi:haloacid dehalogenase-like hydrolase [Candidatus Formimonas warabiya]|uniref:Haloacid dehalogenase-like hydrolase n=1 Tax=Formimonas warabiya TaxID=1761012 RepID=A0A3G1KPC0_FORW1|nr:haloacid dehalogenase-like hydrolase [Candidatus Formimonas warabiya]ATW24297.1 hypothetical protein DCMF_05380 [Candidatus Formimonas warabiya]